MFALGIERLLQDQSLKEGLKGKRVALLGHPASVDRHLEHSLDLLMRESEIEVVSAFGPQHGMRGEKQDNMIESDDYRDPEYNIPVFSLYGKVRRPTPEMLETFDVLLVDMQDVGCRIYTFLTTLFYMLDALDGQEEKEMWVLDRPNPAGRPIEGFKLNMKFESFVGAAEVPMRHGITLGEAGLWYVESKNLKVNFKVVEMLGYNPDAAREWGWPTELSWVNPSPNIPRLSCVRMYPGTVMVEGVTLSEGRGSTIPLEVFGAPDIDSKAILTEMKRLAPQWMESCVLRPCYFEPTFHKFSHQLVDALQVHVDIPEYDQQKFRPFRLLSLYFKALRNVYPSYSLWKQPPYEYEQEKLPIDILSGSDQLRLWVDDSSSQVSSLDEMLSKDESSWEQERKPFLLYDAAKS